MTLTSTLKEKQVIQAEIYPLGKNQLKDDFPRHPNYVMDLIKNGKVLSRLSKFSSYNCYDFCLKCRTAGVNKLSFD